MTKKSRHEIVTTKTGRNLAIIVCTAGQHFGCYAELRHGREVVARTDIIRPYGFQAEAAADARKLAETL